MTEAAPRPTLAYPAKARQRFEALPKTIQVAIAHILACDTPRKRREAFPMVCRRKMRGSRAAPIRRKQGAYEPRHIEVCERDRHDDFVVAVLNKTIWDLAHCDFRTGQVGDFREGRVNYLARVNLAELAGLPVRIDDHKPRGRIRAYRLDRIHEHQVVWDFVFRHQEAEGVPLVHKIKRGAWRLFGAEVTRRLQLAREQKEAREAAREAQGGPPGGPDDRDWPVEVQALVGALARARTNDTDPYADREPPTPRPKPPK